MTTDHRPPPPSKPTAPPKPMPRPGGVADRIIRREWTAALRYAATVVLNPSESAALLNRADRIEAGELTPWAETAPETAPTSTESAEPAPALTHGPENAPRGSQGAAVRWRVGGKVPRNLYRETAEHPDGQDIGRMDTPELAAQVVEAVNRQLGLACQGDVPSQPGPDLAPAADDAPGWDRVFITAMADNTTQDAADQLTALLADFDAHRGALRRASGDRDQAMIELLDAHAEVDRLERERDAARAELAELRAHAEATDNALADAQHQLATARRELDQRGAAITQADQTRRDLVAQLATAHTDGILLARDHVSWDDRAVLDSLAQQVRDGLPVPNPEAEDA